MSTSVETWPGCSGSGGTTGPVAANGSSRNGTPSRMTFAGPLCPKRHQLDEPSRRRSSQRIDRSQRLQFTFDGSPVTGYVGDTILSALYAGGRRVYSRSFKYHRPRGEMCGCGQCTGSLVDVDGRPGIRACGEPARDGMVVRHLNAWPSLGFDLLRAGDLVGGPFMPVGFYYKTFIRPRRLWPLYEKVLRNAAGLGRLPRQQHDRKWRTQYRRRHCDVLVIGGGIAGLAAALRAATLGADVVLCDEDTEPGGAMLFEGGHNRVRAVVTQARAAGVEILRRAPALGYFDGLVPIWQDDVLHQVRAPQHVIATGAVQQPLIFTDNDVPGVMLSGAATRLASLYGVAPGNSVVVAPSTIADCATRFPSSGAVCTLPRSSTTVKTPASLEWSLSRLGSTCSPAPRSSARPGAREPAACRAL